MLHYPPSLQNFVRDLQPRKKLILVLTKTDLVGQDVVEAWRNYLEAREAAEVSDVAFRARVVTVQSYVDEVKGATEQGTQRKLASGQTEAQRERLFAAVQQAHQEIVSEPVQPANRSKKGTKRQRNVVTSVDWQTLASTSKASSSSTSAPPALVQKELEDDASDGSDDDETVMPDDATVVAEQVEGLKLNGKTKVEAAASPLTIGLIGHPNVGKVSQLKLNLEVVAKHASAVIALERFDWAQSQPHHCTTGRHKATSDYRLECGSQAC